MFRIENKKMYYSVDFNSYYQIYQINYNIIKMFNFTDEIINIRFKLIEQLTDIIIEYKIEYNSIANFNECLTSNKRKYDKD